MKKILLVLILLTSGLPDLSGFKSAAFLLTNTAEIPDLSLAAPVSSWLSNYLAFYGFPIPESASAGYFETIAGRTYVLVLEPARPKSTVILLHGYLEHSGNMSRPARALLEHSFRVVLFDLPGHGLSEGARGWVSDFSLYAATLSDIREMVIENFPGSVYFTGHSTGCTACYEMLQGEPRAFRKIVFAAPLVRTSWWQAVQLAYVLSPFLPGVSRSFADSSGDREYQDYLRFISGSDPLQVLAVPRDWVGALIGWNTRAARYPILPESVLVIQGDSDSVLDWQWNLDDIKKHFLWPKIEIIPGGKHILFNESARRRQDVLEKMIRYLEE